MWNRSNFTDLTFLNHDLFWPHIPRSGRTAMGGAMPSNQAPRNVGIVCAGHPLGSNARHSGRRSGVAIHFMASGAERRTGHAHRFRSQASHHPIISQICRNFANGAVLNMVPQPPNCGRMADRKCNRKGKPHGYAGGSDVCHQRRHCLSSLLHDIRATIFALLAAIAMA